MSREYYTHSQPGKLCSDSHWVLTSIFKACLFIKLIEIASFKDFKEAPNKEVFFCFTSLLPAVINFDFSQCQVICSKLKQNSFSKMHCINLIRRHRNIVEKCVRHGLCCVVDSFSDIYDKLLIPSLQLGLHSWQLNYLIEIHLPSSHRWQSFVWWCWQYLPHQKDFCFTFAKPNDCRQILIKIVKFFFFFWTILLNEKVNKCLARLMTSNPWKSLKNVIKIRKTWPKPVILLLLLFSSSNIIMFAVCANFLFHFSPLLRRIEEFAENFIEHFYAVDGAFQ